MILKTSSKMTAAEIERMISIWINAMKRLRISAHATARTLLNVFDRQTPLTNTEAAIIHNALQNSGVRDAETRLNAGWGKLLLTQVTER